MNTNGPVDCVNYYNEYPETTDKNTCHVCLSTGAVVGLSFHAQMGLVSLTALLILLGIIARNYWRNRALPPHSRWPLFRTNIDILMFNLIIADILMSLGAITDVYWAKYRQVFCGAYCNAQGALKTMGATATALSTLAVTIYTFLAIRRVRQLEYSPRICLAVVVGIWVWVLLWAVIPLVVNRSHDLDEKGVQNFYTPTPWWCWVNAKYLPERVVGEYLWLWMAGIGSIALYVPAYYMVRNQRDESQADEQGEADNHSIGNSINESNEAVKILCLMGLFNTLLIWGTRPAILLLDFVGQPNPAGLQILSNNLDPHMEEALPHAPISLNNGSASDQNGETASEASKEPRGTNRFGGTGVSLVRDF
ncbi:G protein coupled glucose receptor regulating Gpa2 protein [Ceratobasidium sp. AG-Ba]|nr:G protein coupled glucose receptor regulating Gpa2 protein [Ceratobasidium sp. AG-Ba]